MLFISSHRIWTFFLFDLAAATCQGSIVRMLRTWFYCSRDTCHPPRIGFGRFFVLLFSPPTRAKVVYCSRRDAQLWSRSRYVPCQRDSPLGVSRGSSILPKCVCSMMLRPHMLVFWSWPGICVCVAMLVYFIIASSTQHCRLEIGHKVLRN